MTRYVLSYEAPPYVPLNDGIWDSPLAYRCDDALAVKSRATLPPGCVFPAFTPTLELSLSQYGAAAALIAWAQQHMTAHWGLAGRGQPLTRLQDEQRVSRNRYTICQRDWQALPPWTAQGGRLQIKDSCDEFPFAGTYQSGASLVQGGTACVQLQAVKTNEWGQSPAQIWTTVQPIGSVRAAAPCVRGHIPLILNTVEGGAYGLFANAQRLLDRDPFWIAVVP
ncbi:hypothetical protein [Thermogemmatispora tikiterensis]|nr:hypothetical protein [Thermogemmatispora tikiterensis]